MKRASCRQTYQYIIKGETVDRTAGRERQTGGRKLTTEVKQKQTVRWQVLSSRSTGSRLNRRQACRMEEGREAVAGGRKTSYRHSGGSRSSRQQDSQQEVMRKVADRQKTQAVG